jgi:RNA polymerase sigma-70 factor, ECF subfamily
MDPDLELLQLWRGGDRRAGDRLFARHFNDVRVYFVVRLPELDQDDLVQEVFKRMVEARDRFEGRSTLRIYLFCIARHVFHETLTKRHRPNGSFDPLSESLADISGRGQSAILAADELLQHLLDALQNIPTKQLEIIDLYYFRELSLKELAEFDAIPLGTAKSRMKAARKRLLAEFNERLGPEAEPWVEDQLVPALIALRDIIQSGRLRDGK